MKHKIVILSTADFDSAVWTNKQHLAVGLSEECDVTYIESLGLRQPTLSASDVRRVAVKLARKLIGKTNSDGKRPSVPANINIVSPIVVPFHKYAPVRWINKLLLHRQLRSVLGESGEAIFWTFSPLTYGVHKKFGTIIYHSVDLLHTLPGVPGTILRQAESDLIADSNHIIASSRGVAEHLMVAGADEVVLWENVAHTEVFSGAVGFYEREDRVVFAGNLTPTKIDFHCFQSILDKGIKISIAGPMDIDGAGLTEDISRILDNPLVDYHGNLSLQELAVVMASSKAAIIPYVINEYTQGVFPMKVYEYLASGLNVISTPLPSLMPGQIAGLSIAEADQFGAIARAMIDEFDESSVKICTEAAATKSWTARIKQAHTLISREGD